MKIASQEKINSILKFVIDTASNYPLLAKTQKFDEVFDIFGFEEELVSENFSYNSPFFKPLKVGKEDKTGIKIYLCKSFINEYSIYNKLEKYLLNHGSEKPFLKYKAHKVKHVNYKEYSIYQALDSSEVIYIVNKYEQKIYFVISENINNSIAGFALSRFIKNISRYRLDRKKLLPLHSAAVDYNGNGILVSGNKFAGKTTTLSNLLEIENINLVSNDIISIDEHLNVYGWPQAVSVRFSTIKLNSILKTYLLNNPQLLYPFNEENIHRKYNDYLDMKNDFHKMKIKFTPNEYAEIFNKRLFEKTRIKVLIFPKYDKNISSLKIETLYKEDIISHLDEQIKLDKMFDPWFELDESSSIHNKIKAILTNDILVLKIVQNEKTKNEFVDLIKELHNNGFTIN
ncbi:hypothetical protein OCA21_09115 [Bacillus cereus]|nr:hypothetical protein [Bacillus cereus]